MPKKKYRTTLNVHISLPPGIPESNKDKLSVEHLLNNACMSGYPPNEEWVGLYICLDEPSPHPRSIGNTLKWLAETQAQLLEKFPNIKAEDLRAYVWVFLGEFSDWLNLNETFTAFVNEDRSIIVPVTDILFV